MQEDLPNEYTVACIFDNSLKRILLIRKNRPEWQKNKLNFLGGHLKRYELPLNCVKREVLEESGLEIESQNFHHIGLLKNQFLNPNKFVVHVFAAIGDIDAAVTKTDEVLGIYSIEVFFKKNCVSNLKFLIPMCLDFFENKESFKFFRIEY